MPRTLERPTALELGLPSPIPNVYRTERGLTNSLLRKGKPQPGRGLYPRDGTATVTDIEAAISELTIPEQELNVIVASGMAAVTGAVEFALQTLGNERETKPKLVHASELYSQSLRAFAGLSAMGVSVEKFNGSDITPTSLIERKKPSVVFAETVANAPGIPVFDVHGLLAITRSMPEDQTPIVVFDNTLPLSTGVDFSEILEPEDSVLVVESATKGAMHNSDHLGVVYSRNERLMDAFREFKVTYGLVTSTHADSSYLRAIEATAPGFHERNMALFSNTGKLALALSRAEHELGANSEFSVSFPTFDDHEHQAYTSEHFLRGVAPVVFMACRDLNSEASRQLLKRISKHPRMKEQIHEGQVYMGQSFGFKEARLLYDRNAAYVRVSGGYDIDADSLAEALYEAAVDV